MTGYKFIKKQYERCSTRIGDKCHESRHVVILLTLHMIGLCHCRFDGSLTSSITADALPICRSDKTKLIKFSKIINLYNYL